MLRDFVFIQKALKDWCLSFFFFPFYSSFTLKISENLLVKKKVEVIDKLGYT